MSAPTDLQTYSDDQWHHMEEICYGFSQVLSFIREHYTIEYDFENTTIFNVALLRLFGF